MKENSQSRAISMLFGILAFASSQSCLAGSVAGLISIASIDTDVGGNIVFIKTSGQKTGVPACQINRAWDFVLNLGDAAGRNMYAMILAAKAAHLPISVRGTGQCNWFSSIETATGVHLDES